MKIDFKESFSKDLRIVKDKRKDKRILKRVKDLIEDVEKANSLSEIPNLKKLKVGSNFYRIRIRDYRVGVSFEKDTFIFVRFLNRKDIYKYFP